jgi:hypothetical protein
MRIQNLIIAFAISGFMWVLMFDAASVLFKDTGYTTLTARHIEHELRRLI